jgi:hypothetical protein
MGKRLTQAERHKLYEKERDRLNAKHEKAIERLKEKYLSQDMRSFHRKYPRSTLGKMMSQ